MKTKAPATIEDLYSVPGKAELIDGEIVHMSPTGGRPGYAGDEIQDSLREYIRQGNKGIAVGDNKAFIVDLPNRRSFNPDVAFHVGKMRTGFYVGAPIFAVEVRSEGDYGPTAERKMAAKRADYFAAGTKVVWDVDVLRENIVRVYRVDNPTQASVYFPGEIAEAEPAVPGWSIPVDRLFADPEYVEDE
ncbi:MAG TPA: Uma2 family endonuclease [Chloroflexia bacterium]|nr:Uma2 family endonuclease [Chloroflexia bacterium]